jgi:hypothetical protein
MDFVRLRVLADGQLLARKLPENEAIGVLTRIKGNKAALAGLTLPRWQGLVLETLAEAEALELALTQEQEEERRDLVIPEELLTIAPASELLVLGKVNNLVDVRVRRVEQVTEVFAFSNRDTENHRAGRRLYERWFTQGTTFLQLASRLQWGEVQLRFANPSEQMRADMERLHLTPELDEIILLNHWMGRLLGINPDAPNTTPPAPRDLSATLLVFFARLLHVANLVWPSNSEQDTEGRQLLVGPYLNTLLNT